MIVVKITSMQAAASGRVLPPAAGADGAPAVSELPRQQLRCFRALWGPRIRAETQAVLQSPDPALAAHYGMIQYHMGWVDPDFRPDVQPGGKQVRPLLCLLACAAMGGDPARALPAAAGIEIAHNFSLVHDDLEDGDAIRRHRPTVWKLWGMPLAVNVGDGMYALSFAAFHRLSDQGTAPAQVLAALRRYTEACVALTDGQHLDISFEQRGDVTVEEYLAMIQGKTGALLAASLAIGALLGGADPDQEEALYHFGRSVGLAFQIQDDILGVWGDPAVTGKAAGNDIVRAKKSLPLLYALNHPHHGAAFRALWQAGIGEEKLPPLMALLEQTGARAVAERWVHRHHREALDALTRALGGAAGSSMLWAVADSLLDRQT